MSLFLIPTEISNFYSIHPKNKELITNLLAGDPLILVEEHKVARRRWLKWGFPREYIDQFILFNEHTQQNLTAEIIKELKQNREVMLMSDCGLPAFCDPGTELVNQAHLNGVHVSCGVIDNSVVMALALSGFKSEQFFFHGFLPRDNKDKERKLEEICNWTNMTHIVMDTPYRLVSLITSLNNIAKNVHCCLCSELTKPNQWVARGIPQFLLSQLPSTKMEFILLIRT